MALSIPILSSLDTKGFDKAAREFKALDTNSAKAGYALKKAFLPAAAALGALGVAAFGAAKLASDFNEEASKSEVIFGDASTAIMEFSKTAATSLGQSQTEALKAAGTFGVLGTAAGLTGTDLGNMAVKFTTLATDLASFNNTSPEDAVLALGAGLRGEAEPLRRFGILLDDAALRTKALELGLVKSTKDALDPQTKSLAAQAIILEQTTLQQGDFARTADGAANKQRILTAQIKDAKTNIGKGFLPVMAIAVGLLSKFAEFASDNAPLIVTMGVVIGGLAAAIVLVNGVMAGFSAIAAITTAANIALATSFTAVQVATVIGIGTAIAGAATLAILAKKISGTVKANKDNTSATKTAAAAQIEYEKMLKGLGTTTDDNTTKTDKNTEATKKADAAKKKLADAAKKLAAELVVLKDALRDQMAKALETANGVLDEAVKKFDGFSKSVSESVKSSFSFGNAQQTAAENVKAVADASDDVAKAQKAVAKAIKDSDPEGLTKAYEDLAVANKKLSDAQSTPKTFLDNLKIQANKVKDFGVLVNRLLAAGLSESALQQVLAAGVDGGTAIAQELLGSAGAILEANTLTADVQSIADTVGENSAKQFYQAGVTAGTNLVAGIQAVVETYNIKLGTVSTAGGVAGLTSGFTGDLNTLMGGGSLNPLAGINFGMGTLMADGGVVTRATSIIAGEAGPEAIIPLDRLGNMGGGDINITVSAGVVSSPDQIGQQLIELIQKAQRRSGTVFAPA
tara:strand:+ start:145 stop:2373 length:2229 start_codon:yes stop_codon:yes gene_type:complete